jgi:class 3 adenylate cyclase/tetratricopeptide (TPR) repeat protein
MLVDRVRRFPDQPPTWIDAVEGTFVFADISGFTRMSERLAEVGKEGAEWLTNIINRYFHGMLDIAGEYGGANVKFGGDALLILFTGEKHPGRAVAAARKMLRANRRFGAVKVERDRIRLGMSIGVHSGSFWSASAGLPGRRMQHLILGREAARVADTEAVAVAGEVMVTESTLHHVGGLRVGQPRQGAYPVLGEPKSIRSAVAARARSEEVPEDSSDLLPYLPPPIVRALQGGAEAHSIEGEHRKVCTIFINVVGVNDLLETKGPAACLDELQQYLSAVVTLTDRHGGFLAANDIYTEDLKLILLFGAPVAWEEDTANAVRFACELDGEIADLNLTLRHRIGINSGFVFAGDLGAPYRREYTVLGDAVNLAARLMSAAVPGQILLSASVVEEAGPGFEVRSLPPMRVKGKEEPIEVGALQREHTVVADSPMLQLGPLCGREAEVETLRNVCRDVEDGRGRAVVISGDAGAGKSRLTREFRDYLKIHGWKVYAGHCYTHTEGTPFAPWVQVLDSLLDVDAADGPEGRSEKVLAAVQALRPDLAELASLLNGVLSLSIPEGQVVRSLDSEGRRRRLFELVTGLLESAAGNSPLVVVLEDVHCADRSSLEMASYVCDRLGATGALLLLTHRPHSVMVLELPLESTIQMPLGELSEDASFQLVRAALERQELPVELAQVITAKAGGNPLFLEELVRSFRASGGEPSEIIREATFALAEESEVSDRIQGLLMSRIDLLEMRCREILRSAAVIGAMFDLTALRSVLGEESRGASDLKAQLQTLMDEDLVSPGEDALGETFRFKNVLVQNIAYNSLLFATRRELHLRAACHIEETHGERLEPHYEALVHHYGRGRDHDRTLLYAVKAGDKARTAFANKEAVAHYQRALSAADECRRQAAPVDWATVVCAHSSLADVSELIGDHEDVIRHYARALQATFIGAGVGVRFGRLGSKIDPQRLLDRAGETSAGTRRGLSEICRKVGSVYRRRSEYELSLDWFRQGLRLLPTRSTLERGRACLAIAGALFRAGSYDEAETWCLRGLRHARACEDTSELAHGHDLLGVILRDKGRVPRAVKRRLRALGLYQQAGNLAGQADTLNNLALDYVNLGRWQEALERFRECLAIASRIGDLDLMAIVHNNMGEVYLAQGDLPRAIAEFRWTIDKGPELAHPAVGALAQANMGEALARSGHVVEARQTMERSLRTFGRIGAHAFVAEVQARFAEVLFLDESSDKAGRLAKKALEDARRVNSDLVEATALRALGRLSAAEQKWDLALIDLETSVEMFRRAGARYQEARSLAALADMLAGKYKELGGRPYRRRAIHLINRAISIFSGLGAEIDLSAARSVAEALDADEAGH